MTNLIRVTVPFFLLASVAVAQPNDCTSGFVYHQYNSCENPAHTNFRPANAGECPGNSGCEPATFKPCKGVPDESKGSVVETREFSIQTAESGHSQAMMCQHMINDRANPSQGVFARQTGPSRETASEHKVGNITLWVDRTYYCTLTIYKAPLKLVSSPECPAETYNVRTVVRERSPVCGVDTQVQRASTADELANVEGLVPVTPSAGSKVMDRSYCLSCTDIRGAAKTDARVRCLTHNLSEHVFSTNDRANIADGKDKVAMAQSVCLTSLILGASNEKETLTQVQAELFQKIMAAIPLDSATCQVAK